MRHNPQILDLGHPDVFVGGVRHDAFAILRRDDPVYWNEERRDLGPGFWNVTRHADVVAVSRDPATFSSAQGINITYEVGLDPKVVNATTEDGAPIPEDLLNGFFLLMVIAGNETTRNSIAGGMAALVQHPDEHRRLREDRRGGARAAPAPHHVRRAPRAHDARRAHRAGDADPHQLPGRDQGDAGAGFGYRHSLGFRARLG